MKKIKMNISSEFEGAWNAGIIIERLCTTDNVVVGGIVRIRARGYPSGGETDEFLESIQFNDFSSPGVRDVAFRMSTEQMIKLGRALIQAGLEVKNGECDED